MTSYYSHLLLSAHPEDVELPPWIDANLLAALEILVEVILNHLSPAPINKSCTAVMQLAEKWEAFTESIIFWRAQAWQLATHCRKTCLRWIPRKRNRYADKNGQRCHGQHDQLGSFAQHSGTACNSNAPSCLDVAVSVLDNFETADWCSQPFLLIAAALNIADPIPWVLLCA